MSTKASSSHSEGQDRINILDSPTMQLTNESDREVSIAAVTSVAIWRQVEKAMSKWKYNQGGLW